MMNIGNDDNYKDNEDEKGHLFKLEDLILT